MNRVVTVNLAGNAYALEEPGYAALKTYLDRAEAALGANPDRSEILHDLEQAIADRLAGKLHAFKSVVNTHEVEEAIAAMGPVEGADAPHTDQQHTAAASGARRKLYRLREGALLAGVTTGVAAYTRIDLSMVRIALVLLVILSFWFGALAYIVAMFIIPTADTPEDWRAAHGLPATAQEVIDNAKARFADFDAKQDWKVWRRWGSEHPARSEPQRFMAPPAPSAGIATRLFAGLGTLILGALGAVATLALLVAIASLITNGAVFGFAPLTAMPLWLSLLLVTLVFGVVSEPMRALRVQCFKTVTGMDERQSAAVDGVVSLGFVIAGALALYHFAPPVRELASNVMAWIRATE